MNPQVLHLLRQVDFRRDGKLGHRQLDALATPQLLPDVLVIARDKFT